MTKRETVLVVGGAGFIGAPVVNALLEREFEVHVLDLIDPEIDGVSFTHINLLEAQDFKPVLQKIGATRMVTLAWMVTPGKFWADHTNADWLACWVRLFRDFVSCGGQRIVGAGTCAEYDWSYSNHYESITPLRPSTLYGQAKLSAGQFLHSLGNSTGVSTAWGRVYFLYGPQEAAGRLVSDVMRSVLLGQDIDCSAGTQHRDFMHVDDVGAAFAALVEGDITGPVNIASGQCVTIRSIIEEIERLADTPDLVNYGARPISPSDPPILAPSTDLLFKEVGFSPKYSLAQGLAQTLEWWRTELGLPDRSTKSSAEGKLVRRTRDTEELDARILAKDQIIESLRKRLLSNTGAN